MRILAVLFLCLLLAAVASPRTITVDDDAPADFNNIQAAIDDANDGDTVEIQPGTYTGDGNRDIGFDGKAITVRSIDPNDPNVVAATIIDCNGAKFDPHRAFDIRDNAGRLSVIAGLKIINGCAWELDGGAIYCAGSSMIVRNCIIQNNEAIAFCYHGTCWAGRGAAVYCTESDAVITDCTIIGNAGIDTVFFFDSTGAVTDCTIIDNTGSNAYAFSYNTVVFLNSTGAVTDCSLTGNDARAIYCDRSTLEVIDCTIIGNRAYDGAGLTANEASFVTIDRCIMANNRAYDSGGAVAIGSFSEPGEGSTVTISNSTLSGNSSVGWRQGGAIACWWNDSLILIDSELTGNYTNNNGGAVWCTGELTISGCRITGNRADDGGGGISAQSRHPVTITDSLIAGNAAGYCGGIVCGDQYASAVMTNCTIAHNRAKTHAGGINFDFNTAVSNCILWGNTDHYGANIANIQLGFTSTLTVSYSNVQGGRTGVKVVDPASILNWATGNIDAAPCFVDPGHWDPNGTPEDANDDFWIDGDYHLKSQGWRWDVGRETWTWDDLTSRSIDAGNPGSLLGDEPLSIPVDPNNDWGSNLRINMGAYGGTSQASIAPHGWALLSDITNDGIVNFDDFTIQAATWLTYSQDQPADLNRNALTAPPDLALLANDWLNQTTWSAPPATNPITPAQERQSPPFAASRRE